MKLTWRLVNEVINKRKTKQSSPSAFMSEGKMITVILKLPTDSVNTSLILAPH